MTNTKSLSDVQIKDVEKGTVEAVFSTFGVIDKDGEVTYKTSFTEGASVTISAYGHTSWDGSLPVGRGTIVLTDNEAVLKGRFFMDTTHGLDTFRTVKALSEGDSLQEWSYSLRNVTSEPVEVDGVKARGLMKIDVNECSPVLVGASVNTRTLAMKAGALTFSEQLDIALRGVEQLTEMTRDRLSVRVAAGKSIDEQIDAHARLFAEIEALKAAIDGATQTTLPAVDLANEYARFIALTNGVTYS